MVRNRGRGSAVDGALGGIADHFVLSAPGFPQDAFTDLKLPVVDPDGTLDGNALQTAHGGRTASKR